MTHFQHRNPATDDAADELWRPVAEAARSALGALGHGPKNGTLPGEAYPDGGSCAEHAAAWYGTLRALVNHRIAYFPPSGALYIARAARVKDSELTETGDGAICGGFRDLRMPGDDG